jgi:gluconolactonase
MPNRAFLAAALALLLGACAEARSAAGDADSIPASYPEGPLYVGETLYYTEMGADRVTKRVDGQNSVFFYSSGCGPTAIAPYGQGFLVLCHMGARVVAVDAAGHELRFWEEDKLGRHFADPNDCSADGRGGVYFSDPGLFSKHTMPGGYIVHLSAAGVATTVAENIWYPNGVFVDRSGQYLYVDEHMANRIWRYRIGADASIGERAVFADLNSIGLPPIRYGTPYPETGPDGLEIGPNGDVYVAQYGAGRIIRLSPAGALVDVIETPARYITNIAFDPAGNAATTGPFINDVAPFRGEVRFFSAARLTRARY